ncbi:DUF4232 domain-containing protein [Streptomyces fulvoviolaceus]|uniref:DUF4232 domain-containing protein n=1 Tax=Streptomyces fulvoviolaceus TaxID=285535 RepID=UPI000A6DFDD2|nr:DUF4232 domain-containing protein [Streptomyces fulvoviolaceus]MCT9078247.1 DUF4232 domain-containing protein [Streptomyces fulvoviolaceus]
MTRLTTTLDTALRAVAGIIVAAVIWSVSEAVFDEPAPLPKRAACPTGGVRVTAGPVNPAMGLRAMALTLENCGTRVYRVEGYPVLRLLDADQQQVTGVSVVHGSGGIATVTGFDDPPRPVSLEPGETASAGLLWRNTVAGTDGATGVPYVSVQAKAGALGLLVAPDGGLDLGTTGKLGVGPWRTGGSR